MFSLISYGDEKRSFVESAKSWKYFGK